MPLFFYDLENGSTNYIDKIGTELADISMVPAEVQGFQRMLFADKSMEAGNSVSTVSVRDERGLIIFRSVVTTNDVWLNVGFDGTMLRMGQHHAISNCA